MLRCYLVLGAVLFSTAVSLAQTPAPVREMTLDEFRHYLDVLHIKEADERGVQAQSKTQRAQLPPWFPPALWDEMVAAELKVDFAPIEYGYVRSCVSSPEIGALSAMFATPEGQQYAAKMTGAIVAKEAHGTSPTAAREYEVDHDTGLPLKALDHVSPGDRTRLTALFKRDAMDCMSSGFQKASVDVTDARTKVAREIVATHRDELIASRKKYEADQTATGK